MMASLAASQQCIGEFLQSAHCFMFFGGCYLGSVIFASRDARVSLTQYTSPLALHTRSLSRKGVRLIAYGSAHPHPEDRSRPHRRVRRYFLNSKGAVMLFFFSRIINK